MSYSERKAMKAKMEKEAAEMHPAMKAQQEKMKAKMDDKDGDGKPEPDSEEVSKEERIEKLKSYADKKKMQKTACLFDMVFEKVAERSFKEELGYAKDEVSRNAPRMVGHFGSLIHPAAMAAQVGGAALGFRRGMRDKRTPRSDYERIDAYREKMKTPDERFSRLSEAIPGRSGYLMGRDAAESLRYQRKAKRDKKVQDALNMTKSHE